MSQYDNDPEIPKHVEAGRFLSERLRVARKMAGAVRCPSCHARFDATHVMKCPECRRFLDESFQAVCQDERKNRQTCSGIQHQKMPSWNTRASSRSREKPSPELDFFSQGYMEYKE
ncbi:hypothetical protein CSB45_05365 [candidate division KSB3 bacterium]|uniref:Uncharacterized protein n=1 Tax=candidate division KSB3 bacterium TaxID=2044937 RepID=A0A2G6E7Q2_9BACT|nr:MAG: hypothetical protein CSB45_05365 [candidate division KSB3 bacterium]